MRRTIICLANSYKHGGRCVAGVCVETGQWFRLRGAAPDGALYPREYTLSDGAGELRLMDVFEADLHYAMPSNCHPEDWAVTPVPWRLVARGCSVAHWKLLDANVDDGTSLLGGYRDRIAADDLQRKPAKASLALIEADDLWWWIREDEHGKRKNRALFRRNRVTFNLAVTDPRWLEQLNLLPLGIYANSLIAPHASRTFLTVSLSEAFEVRAGAGAWHYRIVAGVLTR
jgi:hypothetical protein